MDIGLIILGIIMLCAVVLIFIYNRLISLREKRQQSFADIDVQLKQRFELIPNLIETVKGYAGHEKTVLENITAARAGVKNAQTPSQRIGAENALTRAISGFYLVAENYPDLKANETFKGLMSELSDIENKLSAARRFFNSATAEFNTAIKQSPAVLFARAVGFQEEEFFELPSETRTAMDTPPAVKFG